MTLATITALINSKIRNKTPKVLKTEHADVEQAIVNEIYSEPKFEEITGTTELSTNTIIELPSIQFNTIIRLNFTKKGNIVFVYGYITNNESFNLGNSQMFRFKTGTEFVPLIDGDNFLVYHNINTNGNLYHYQNSVELAGGLSAFSVIYINGFYYVNQ